MSMRSQAKKVYDDGRTKQSFKDETDINKILQRAQKTGTISHLNQHEGRYGDFSNFDFFGAQLMLTRGREIFDDLPSEVRAEFSNSQGAFFAYVNDPANKDRLGELLPALAEPGRQNITPTAPKADELAVLQKAEESAKPKPEAEPKAGPEKAAEPPTATPEGAPVPNT